MIWWTNRFERGGVFNSPIVGWDMSYDDDLQDLHDLYMDRHDLVEDDGLETGQTSVLNDVDSRDLFGDDDVAF